MFCAGLCPGNADIFHFMKLVIGPILFKILAVHGLVTRGLLAEMRTSNLSENILADADGLWA